MKQIGKVELIVNELFLVISSSEELFVNQVVIVFTPFQNEKIKEYGLEYLAIPKGHISITDKAGKNLYLAEVFQQSREKKKIITYPSSFEQLSAGGLMKLFERTKEEVVDLAPGEWSGVLDKKNSMKFEFKREIAVGDLIGYQ